MTLKRKLSFDFDEEVEYSTAKRPNLIPFPQTEMDVDVAMSDSSSDAGLLTPLSIPDYSFHARLPSNASTISSDVSSLSNSPTSSPYYPHFVLYPAVDQEMSADTPNYFSQPTASPKPVGLIQPRGNSFTHHGNCHQIPKLRMSCAAGPNGQRTMWAHCEQCGAIEMVDIN
ncbi:hypothetical protein EIP86_009173 [Pleurotus ostreatoroseus]|nr:hypothetical protein EIP86_009173 [Pleurotus ostreatoroseus]